MFEWISTGHSLVPHPHRLFAHLNMFFAIVLALGLSAVFDKFDISEQMNVEKWSSAGKSLGAMAFGLFSFLILSAGAFIFSPFAVLFLTGESGIWTRISSQVVAERSYAFFVAGENFRLVRLESGSLQIIAGVVLTLISFLILFSISVSGEEG